MANNNKNEKDLVCSFCGKHQDEVERMIIGPGTCQSISLIMNLRFMTV